MTTDEKYKIACQKELEYLKRKETAIRKQSAKSEGDIAERLKDKIPPKVKSGVEKAFKKAFEIIVKHGNGVVCKTFSKESLEQEYLLSDYEVQLKKNRNGLKNMRRRAGGFNHAKNLSVAAIEGMGLGVLGIGMPDVVIFTGLVMKGCYETALRYGYDYEAKSEMYLILKMIEGALVKGVRWEEVNCEVDELLTMHLEPTDEEMNEQIARTAEAFAIDMVVLRFVQGMPVVGIVGGVGNGIYYQRIMKYANLKYHKRYLLKELERLK